MADSSPMKDFLTTIGLGQHRDALKTAGYDDYAQMGANELEAMRGELVGAGSCLNRRREDERYSLHLGGDMNTSGWT